MPVAYGVLGTGDMQQLPSLDVTELRNVIGGAARETKRAGVAAAMQALKNSGSVSSWLSNAMVTKHGGYTCACGCNLPNCR